MKKLAVIAIVVLSLFVAGSAMAASFDVTNNFGIRVVEKGACERIGATTLTPVANADVWLAGDVITVELLGNATVCGDISTGLDYGGIAPAIPGTPDYTVTATNGDDFFTITINTTSVATEAIRYGHDGSGTEICFNLATTTYNSQDPNNQLVKVSYRDDASNTYSGDIYVATVKPQAHLAALCTKTVVGNGTNFLGGADLSGWGDSSDAEDINKDGLPEIPLCFTGSTDQAQNTTTCGAAMATTPACLTIDDPANTFDGSDYTFSFATTKTGIGIRSVALFDKNGALYATEADGLTAITYTYYNAAGTDITATVNPAVASSAVTIKKIKVNAAGINAGKVYAVLYFAYDTCTAAAGPLAVDITFNKLPCGDSFSKLNFTIAQFIACAGQVTPTTTYTSLFPYFPNNDTGWWTGMALTNLSNSDITVSLTIYEADGDMYTGTVNVVANGITADIFSGNSYAGQTLTTTSGDATLGDERFRVEASSNGGKFTGFGMIGDGVQGQGYLTIDATATH